jgi:8-oxo-dGTP diphosphatase
LCVVGGVIHDRNGRAFIQRRTSCRTLFPGTWDIVGGHVAPSEQLVEALQREIAEETGWRLARVLVELNISEWIGADGLTRREADYLVEVEGNLTRPLIEVAKHDQYRWITRRDLPMLLENRSRGDDLVFRIVERALALLHPSRRSDGTHHPPVLG